MVKSHVN